MLASLLRILFRYAELYQVIWKLGVQSITVPASPRPTSEVEDTELVSLTEGYHASESGREIRSNV